MENSSQIYFPSCTNLIAVISFLLSFSSQKLLVKYIVHWKLKVWIEQNSIWKFQIWGNLKKYETSTIWFSILTFWKGALKTSFSFENTTTFENKSKHWKLNSTSVQKNTFYFKFFWVSKTWSFHIQVKLGKGKKSSLYICNIVQHVIVQKNKLSYSVILWLLTSFELDSLLQGFWSLNWN